MTTYQKNLEVIFKVNKDVAAKIEHSQKPDWVDRIKAKNGKPNMVIQSQSNRIPAYDMENPVKHPRAYIKESCFYNENISVVVGMGFGYLLYETLKKKDDKHFVILVEPQIWFIKAALEIFDFTKWILNGTLAFVLDGESAAVTLYQIDNARVIEQYNMLFDAYINLRPAEYNKIVADVCNQLNSMQCNTGTVMSAGFEFAKNDIANLPYLIRHRGIAELKKLYSGKPGVVVSTGPSLMKNVHELIEMQGKVVIVAVAQALRPLLAYGIRPDFICTVDFGSVNYEHFAGLMDSDVPLVVLNRSYDRILKEWQGPKFVVATPQPAYQESAVDILSNKGYCEQGGSVAHMALSFAVHLGCSQITLIGQDLAYDSEYSHIPLADASGKININDDSLSWNVDDPGSHLKKPEAYDMGMTKWVPGYFGEYVPTNAGLASFITGFENMVKTYNRKFFNSTEGGADIKGFKRMTLKRYLETYCNKNIDKSKIKKYYGLAEDADKLIEEVIPKLKADIDLLNRISVNASKGLRAAGKAEKAGKDETLLKEAFAENEKYSKEAHNLSKKAALMGIAIYNESRQIAGHKLKAKGKVSHLLKNEQDRSVRIERNKLILKAAIKAARKLRVIYKTSLDMIERFHETKDESILTAKSDFVYDLSKCQEYFDKGNWAWPMLAGGSLSAEYQTAYKMRKEAIEKAKAREDQSDFIEYLELLEKGREIGAKGKYVEAMKLLWKARKLFPKRPEARWGYATVLHHTGKIEKACEEYEAIIQDFPNNLTFKYEYGQVLLKRDPEKAIKIIAEVMEKTHQYDSFFYHLGEIYRTQKNHSKAVAAYEEYSKCFPADPRALEKLIDCYHELKDEKAEKEAKKRLGKLK